MNFYFFIQGEVMKTKGLNTIMIKQETQPAIACSKLIIEAPEQGVKYVQS